MAEQGISNSFEPSWAVPPGATIAAILSARSLSRENFAKELGESVESVQRLLLGLDLIDNDLAARLSRCLGSTKEFWIAREAQFRADSDRIREDEADIERVAWVKQFPVKEMLSLGWIGSYQSAAEAAHECLKLFGVSDVAMWRSRYTGVCQAAAFRVADHANKNPGAITAWLRWAELVAERTPCGVWNPEAFRERLQFIRRLTWQKDPAKFLAMLRRVCAEVGVVVVVARTPKGCPASGATRFLSARKAMMVLSFRYRSDDQFWFTFFHEAGHLLLHGHDALFLENEGFTPDEEKEVEANIFAEEYLVPASYKAALLALPLNKDAILSFARRVGVAPGVIVGQLQHYGRVGPDQLNWLKRRYKWDSIEAGRLIP